MDIHDFENNLGDINNSCKNEEKYENKTHDNIVEMNPYAVNNETIHDDKSTYNITMIIKEDEDDKCEDIGEEDNNEVNESNQNTDTYTSDDFLKVNAKYFRAKIMQTLIDNHNRKVRARQMNERRNDIMRSVAAQNKLSKNNIRRYIRNASVSGYKNNNAKNSRLNVIRNKPNIAYTKINNLVTNHSQGNYIRADPSVTTTTIPIPSANRSIDIFQIKADLPNPVAELNPWVATTIMPDIVRYPTMPPVVEKPKEINFAEVVTSVLQEILSGKYNSVENIIGKLRVKFEENSVLTNSKKRNIILLNFEDDTMRPVLKIEDKYMDIIQQWYDDCEILIDIEETSVSIPEVITIQDVSGVIFQDINCKYKDEYLNVYIPLVINNIISERSIKGFEKKYFKKINPTNSYEQKELKNSGDKIISDMGIVIPENIKPEPIEPKKPPQNDYFFNLPVTDIYYNIKRIDPEILVKTHLLDDVRKNEPSKSEITSYNNIYEEKNCEPCLPAYNNCEPSLSAYEYNAKDGLKTAKRPLLAYNSEYNVLYPNFSDTCASVLDVDIKENTEESNVPSIFVLINDKFLQTITIEKPDADILHIIKTHSEFGFVKLFGITTNNKDIVNFIEREFNKTQFNDIDEINKKLLVTSQYIEFSNKHNNANNIVSSEENLVKKFLNSKYTFDDDINHKMKASTLYDIIINSKVVKIDNDKVSGFRTRLSKYLKDIGLQKKRYNDGFYYYGIVEKYNLLPDINTLDTRRDKIHLTLKEITRQREEEYLSFSQTL